METQKMQRKYGEEENGVQIALCNQSKKVSNTMMYHNILISKD